VKRGAPAFAVMEEGRFDEIVAANKMVGHGGAGG